MTAYDWTRYERTCAPDRQLDGLGDLALFLGGSEDSFTGKLLALIAKAQSTPANLAGLERGFPREVTAWRVWRSMGDPTPTAADLCAALTLQQQIAETRAEADRAFHRHHHRTPDQFGDIR